MSLELGSMIGLEILKKTLFTEHTHTHTHSELPTSEIAFLKQCPFWALHCMTKQMEDMPPTTLEKQANF
jgi:hypothetical protein